MRLSYWEKQGFSFHLAAGLPTSVEVFSAAFRSLSAPSQEYYELVDALRRLTIERFSWQAMIDMGVYIALDDLDRDAALDAIAELLWATRNQGQKGPCAGE